MGRSEISLLKTARRGAGGQAENLPGVGKVGADAGGGGETRVQLERWSMV